MAKQASFLHRTGEENGAGLGTHSCFGVDYELSLILKEIRVITDQVIVLLMKCTKSKCSNWIIAAVFLLNLSLQMRKDDEDADISRDWKFAAMVVDRMCLIIFTLFTIVATLAVLLSAPHIMVS